VVARISQRPKPSVATALLDIVEARMVRPGGG
jgi:hypothetical protein